MSIFVDVLFVISCKQNFGSVSWSNKVGFELIMVINGDCSAGDVYLLIRK